jgi:mitogen-activated protein kinase kinase kinase
VSILGSSIEPSNDLTRPDILLDHLGVIKYVDFGAAKILEKTHRSIQRSRRGTEWSSYSQMPSMNGGVAVMSNGLTGTPMYMSPEVIKNDKRGRHGAMDIWSLGCVVLEIATGKKPWSNLDNEWCAWFAIPLFTGHLTTCQGNHVPYWSRNATSSLT